MSRERIYLDHAATTPLRREVADTMRAAAADCDFNPSSLHAEGRRARAVLDAARDHIAELLGASRKEITFTASGSESDNQAFAGFAGAARRPGRMLATAIEHHAVLHALERAATDGVDAGLLGVTEEGLLEADRLLEELGQGSLLLSVMYANNEIGSVQPIARVAELAHARGAVVHTDAVQAPCWLPLDVRTLGVDMLSLSAHKFGGPKGVGLLYVRDGVAIEPLVVGGGQEFGRRSGTENLTGIVGMARALGLAVAERAEQAERVAALRDRFESAIRATIPEVRVNGAGAPRLANNLNVSFAGVDSATLLARLDLEGIAASAGSACTSGVLQPSHVLAALGIDPRWQRSAIRFSLGTATTAAEIDRVLEVLPGIVRSLRRGAEVAP